MIGGQRILVLEDEPLIAMDLEDLLTSKGFTVVGPFSTAARARLVWPCSAEGDGALGTYAVTVPGG